MAVARKRNRSPGGFFGKISNAAVFALNTLQIMFIWMLALQLKLRRAEKVRPPQTYNQQGVQAMKKLCKAIVFCCILAMGATGMALDAPAGPGGTDKVEKNAGGGHGNRGNQGDQGHRGNDKDWDHGDGILDGVTGGLVSAGITLAAARQLALDGGYTGYSALPPGIAKNLARGKPLPPGIARKMVPGGMLTKLPAHPGYEWRVLGSDLVLVAIGSSVIADVLHDVFH